MAKSKCNKYELAALVTRLWENIDKTEQAPSIQELFTHLDNAYLMRLICEFRDSVKFNIASGQHHLLSSNEAELRTMLEEARKALGEPKENNK